MPMYGFKCAACQHTETHFLAIQDYDAKQEDFGPCPKCQKPEWRRMFKKGRSPRSAFHKPIEMFSIALDTDEEIRAFKKQCPDVEISINQNDDMYGVPVANDRHAKMQALKAAGFVERK